MYRIYNILRAVSCWILPCNNNLQQGRGDAVLTSPSTTTTSSAMRYHAGHSVQIVAQKTVSLAPLLHRWTVINTTTPSPPSFGFLFFPSSFLFSAGRTTEKHDIDYRCQRRFFFTFFLFYYYFIFIELVSICLICCSLLI